MILLDTNICIGFLRGDEHVVAAYKRNSGNVAISAMTVGELFFGVGKSDPEFVEKNRRLVELFISRIPVVQTNNAIMERFGYEKARLETAGTPLDDADVIIAATALSLNAPIATSNIKHFNRFPSLRLENWFDMHTA